MEYTIGFKDLPFCPEKSQVVYVENGFDETVNNFIKCNYVRLHAEFEKNRLDFVYLPFYFDAPGLKEKVQYSAPYLLPRLNELGTLSSSYLLNYMSHPENRSKMSPSLLFLPRSLDAEWVFSAITLDDVVRDNVDVSTIVERVVRMYPRHVDSQRENPQSLWDFIGRIFKKKTHETDLKIEGKDSGGNTEPRIRFRIVEKGERAEESKKRISPLKVDLGESLRTETEDTSETDIKNDIDRELIKLQSVVESLRLKGVPLGVIHEFLDSQEPISPLVITEDLRLFLPSYDNIEIELSAQIKAFYFLFLNHPEGIVLQRLDEYHGELMNYYGQTNKGGLQSRWSKVLKNWRSMETTNCM